MGIPVIDTGPMTVEEFYDFTDRRPDGEKWELIDGEAVINASPLNVHQVIVRNLLFELTLQQRRMKALWNAIPGIGALVSPVSRPEPDVMVLPSEDRIGGSIRDTDRSPILFEVTSPSTMNHDLKWKRIAYTSMPALMHYVVVSQDTVLAMMVSRVDGFTERWFSSAADVLSFPELGLTLPLADVYRDTGLC